MDRNSSILLHSANRPTNPSLRVLLIDDNAEDRVRVIQELTPGVSEFLPGFSGLLIDEVADEKRFNYLLEVDDFEAVLTESVLSWTDGLSVLRAVKERYPHCPVIMLTSSGSERLAAEAMKSGLDDYLVKSREDLGRLWAAVWSALERAQTRQAEAAAVYRLRSLFEDLPMGVYRATPKGEIFDVNPAFMEMLGYSPAESLADINFAEFCLKREEWQRWQQVLMDRTGVVRGFEAELRRKDGQVIWVRETARAERDVQGRLLYYEGILEDITEQKRAEEELGHHARQDALTGLPNRVFLIELLRHLVQPVKPRKESLFAVLYLDLDRFKLVNESLGHSIGDELLLAVAKRLETCLRPEDTVARLGGDEFAILLQDLKAPTDAVRVANRVQEQLAQPFLLEGHEVFATASIGIALSTKGYEWPEDLLRDAETAMYRAKTLGKNRHQVFDGAMHSRVVEVLKLETDLRRGLERSEFRVHYQPIVSLENGRIVAFEALLRWQHPEQGLVYPADFLAVAEESGVMVPVSWWILRQACRRMHEWQTRFRSSTLCVNVNLSYNPFMQPDLVDQIDEILKETGLDAGSLNLELVENVIMENVLRVSAESAIAKLLELKALGIRVIIDDFGTGYSSLSYLQRFPAHMLKIDRSFVARMGMSQDTSDLVRLIITVAQAMNMEVVAEGVETKEQLEELKKLKCDYAQGYLFSKPVESDAAAALLASWNPKE